MSEAVACIEYTPIVGVLPGCEELISFSPSRAFTPTSMTVMARQWWSPILDEIDALSVIADYLESIDSWKRDAPIGELSQAAIRHLIESPGDETLTRLRDGLPTLPSWKDCAHDWFDPRVTFMAGTTSLFERRRATEMLAIPRNLRFKMYPSVAFGFFIDRKGDAKNLLGAVDVKIVIGGERQVDQPGSQFIR